MFVRVCEREREIPSSYLQKGFGFTMVTALLGLPLGVVESWTPFPPSWSSCQSVARLELFEATYLDDV